MGRPQLIMVTILIVAAALTVSARSWSPHPVPAGSETGGGRVHKTGARREGMRHLGRVLQGKRLAPVEGAAAFMAGTLTVTKWDQTPASDPRTESIAARRDSHPGAHG